MSLSLTFWDTRSFVVLLANKLGWRLNSSSKSDEYYNSVLTLALQKITELNNVNINVVSRVPVDNVPSILKLFVKDIQYQ